MPARCPTYLPSQRLSPTAVLEICCIRSKLDKQFLKTLFPVQPACWLTSHSGGWFNSQTCLLPGCGNCMLVSTLHLLIYWQGTDKSLHPAP